MGTRLLLMMIVTFPVTNSQDCDPVGWFGLNCQYKCRCAGPDNCNRTDGSCLGGAKCLGGWFGPACQYVDLAYNTLPDKKITDGNDDTCANSESNEITVSFSESITFTWLRISVSDVGKNDLTNVQVTLIKTGFFFGRYSSCKGKRSVVDDRTLDIFCDGNGIVKSLILTGEAVRYLCSVYVSGDCPPGKYGKDCHSTCSRGCAPGEFDETTCDHINGTCLYLCLPGYLGDRCDTDCPPGKYGNDCNSSCSEGCAPGEFNQTTCDHINGTCLYLCLPGYLGDMCDTGCPASQYGKDCNSTCNENCAPGESGLTTCDHINGTCLYLCLPGYFGDRCDTDCPPGKYGKDCNSSCSEGCAPGEFDKTTCDHINGTCLYMCLPGYLGDMCDTDCPPGKYGKDCNSSCNEGCAPGEFDQTTCDHINGTCLYLCLPGYLGDMCDTAFTSSYSETNVITPAVIVPVVVVLVACILISVVFIRKQRRNTGATSKATYENEPSVSKFQLESRDTLKPKLATNKVERNKIDDTRKVAADTKAANSTDELYSIPVEAGDTSENFYSSLNDILK